MNIKEYRERIQTELSTSSKPDNDEVSSPQQLSEGLYQKALDILADDGQATEARQNALDILATGLFTGSEFGGVLPNFKVSLVEIAEKQSNPQELRHTALETLISLKDENARTLLIDGLKDPQKAALSPASALELLSRDDHSSVSSLAQEIFEKTHDVATRKQAIRIMSADPSTKELLVGTLRNVDEFREVRRASAVALRSLDEDVFNSEAESILADESDFPDIKSTLEGVLRRTEKRQK